jgi:serine protease Do
MFDEEKNEFGEGDTQQSYNQQESNQQSDNQQSYTQQGYNQQSDNQQSYNQQSYNQQGYTQQSYYQSNGAQQENRSEDVNRPYQQFMNRSNGDDYVWNSQPNYNQQSSYSSQPTPPKKKKNGAKKVIAAVVAAAVVASGAMTVTGGWDKLFPATSSTNNTSNIQIGSTLEDKDTSSDSSQSDENKTTVEMSTDTSSSSSGSVVITDVSSIVDDVMPAIVAITSRTLVDSGNYWNYWYGYNNEEDSQTEVDSGAGSGIIVQQTDTELLIVTNNHVVEGASSLSVKFINDVSVDANIKGTDSSNDLAVVAIPLENIDDDTLSAIKKATIGSSDDLKVGEGVIAIGNALGYGQSVTTGVISAVNREVYMDEDTTMTMLQTDAAINGGNSGGALLNSKGEVIGINSAKYSSNSYSSASIEGMGFAIPISSATDIINNLMNQETKTKVDEDKRGYLGITGADVSDEYVQSLGMPNGVLVSKVEEDGAADKAGIQARDIITAINGTTVESMTELKEQLAYYAVGDKVTITIQYMDNREYVSKDVEVTLQKSSN